MIELYNGDCLEIMNKLILDGVNVDTINKLHPTQKNVECIEYMLKISTDENEIILDPYMGSGTTGLACKNLNRNFIGIELDKEYFEIAQGRINE